MAIRRVRSGVLAVKDEDVVSQALTALIGAIAGIVGAVAVLWGKLRETQAKREETQATSAHAFIGLGKDLIDDLLGEVKELRTATGAHSDQLITVWKEVHLYKAQAVELTGRVEQQTLRLQEQDYKIETQNATIEALSKDNATLKRENTELRKRIEELMGQVRDDMQFKVAARELLVDAQVESEELGDA
jgi:chromosome segregation ATPase